MCVSPHALLSALVNRVRRGGAAVTRDEVVAVLGAGCSRDDVQRALAELGTGEDLLASIADADVKRR
jgi:hypothetical protein